VGFFLRLAPKVIHNRHAPVPKLFKVLQVLKNMNSIVCLFALYLHIISLRLPLCPKSSPAGGGYTDFQYIKDLSSGVGD